MISGLMSTNKLLKTNNEITLIKQNYEATPQALKVSKEEKANKGSFKFLIIVLLE